MKSKLFKAVSCIIGTVMLMASFLCTNAAENESYTYTYSNTGDITFSPDLYDVENVFFGDEMGIGNLNSPDDIEVDKNGNIYIADTQNNRIVFINRIENKATVLKNFIMPDGSITQLKKPEGICIDKKGCLYICDTENNRILLTNLSGKVERVILKPESAYFTDTIEFIPTKIAVDSVGNLYVSATGVYQGLTMFSDTGDFIGFYGAEEVAATADVIADYIWKQFITEEQRKEMANYVPNEVCNIFISDEDFVFTVTNSHYIPGTMEKTEMDTIRLLNPKGVNILNLDATNYPGKAIVEDAKFLNFVSGFVDENGFVTIIDNSKGRIFQFDSSMNLMAIFGAIGSSDGMFGRPVDINGFKDELYVLDGQKGCVTVFKRNEYGSLIYDALQTYNTAAQTEAIGPWRKVLERNANYDLAYVGIGRALLNSGDVKEAMQYFKTGHDSKLYNEAFQIYRVELVRSIIGYAVIGLAVIIIAVIFVMKKFKKTALAEVEVSKFGRFINAIKSPASGFERLHTKKALSMPIALGCLAFFAAINFFEIQFTGKQFSMVNINEINLFWRIFSYILIVCVWTLANWCICVLIEGKATLREIFIFSCYSLVPYTVANYIKIFLTNFLIREENMFLFCLILAGFLWSLVMMIQAFVYFHEFEAGDIIKSFVLTIIGMAIIAILIFVVYMLMQQLISTLIIIVNEIQFNIRMGW